MAKNLTIKHLNPQTPNVCCLGDKGGHGTRIT